MLAKVDLWKRNNNGLALGRHTMNWKYRFEPQISFTWHVSNHIVRLIWHNTSPCWDDKDYQQPYIASCRIQIRIFIYTLSSKIMVQWKVAGYLKGKSYWRDTHFSLSRFSEEVYMCCIYPPPSNSHQQDYVSSPYKLYLLGRRVDPIYEHIKHNLRTPSYFSPLLSEVYYSWEVPWSWLLVSTNTSLTKAASLGWHGGREMQGFWQMWVYLGGGWRKSTLNSRIFFEIYISWWKSQWWINPSYFSWHQCFQKKSQLLTSWFCILKPWNSASISTNDCYHWWLRITNPPSEITRYPPWN